MSARNLLFAQLVVVASLASVHRYAMTNYFYWLYPLFDTIPHFLAGLWAGLFAFWLAVKFGKEPSLFFGLGMAFMLGVTWEIFEALIGMTHLPSDILDTLKDLSVDLIGAGAGIFLSRRFFHPRP
jgi:uncharacterized membrane protein YjdF